MLIGYYVGCPDEDIAIQFCFESFPKDGNIKTFFQIETSLWTDLTQ